MQKCFVIMPFRPELAYLYRQIKQHITQSYPEVEIARGDDTTLPTPLLEKIVDLITQADVVIADCSGRNPNVFYELGMAHALGKPVILITSEDAEVAPADIRSFEFISYAKLGPDEFLAQLSGALENVVGNPFVDYYEEALEKFNVFVETAGVNIESAGEEQFVAAMSTKQASGKPLPRQARARDEHLIRSLLGEDPDIQLLIKLNDWLDEQYPP